MALTIYKISEYVNWKVTGGATYISGGGAGSAITPPIDLSSYYTKIQLQTAGQAQVSLDNIQLDFVNSIIEAGGLAQLVNDLPDPGVNKLYGTNAFGIKGWFDLPVPGGGGSGVQAIPTPVDNQIAIWVNADHIEGMAGLTYDGNALEVAGDLHITGGIATGDDFALSSDRKLKKNIKDYKAEEMYVEYKQFELKAQPDQIRYGVIAQELEKKYPELVRNNNGTLTVSYFDLLIREIVYLKNKIKELEDRF